MKNITTFEDVIAEANQLSLYHKLITQLNKDLILANIDLEFNEEVQPISLKLMLHQTIFKLIQEKFMNYLNLLYVIDVSEEQVKQLDGTDVMQLSEDVTFLILKREWQKVYYRNKFQS